jgi:hypothetical protein
MFHRRSRQAQSDELSLRERKEARTITDRVRNVDRPPVRAKSAHETVHNGSQNE